MSGWVVPFEASSWQNPTHLSPGSPILKPLHSTWQYTLKTSMYRGLYTQHPTRGPMEVTPPCRAPAGGGEGRQALHCKQKGSPLYRGLEVWVWCRCLVSRINVRFRDPPSTSPHPPLRSIRKKRERICKQTDDHWLVKCLSHPGSIKL